MDVLPQFQFGIVTLFPEMFSAFLTQGVIGRAVTRGQISCELINPRIFAENAHHTVDDRPYGGGPGMVMLAEPLSRSVAALKALLGEDTPVCYLSPRGAVFNHRCARERALNGPPKLILICGRYEGVDERFIESCVDFQWSIGDYVLSGGELPAQIVMDAMSRWLPGVLGDGESAEQDSFESGLLDCPHYTRPLVWDGREVPAILTSGHHANIQAWRMEQAAAFTQIYRPDLWAAWQSQQRTAKPTRSTKSPSSSNSPNSPNSPNSTSSPHSSATD